MTDIIDLRSDTVTLPSPGMMKAMMSASVGDDVLGDDPTVIALESMVMEMFGKEAAVFCPSGTMTNQIAIKTHTQPGDEVICDIASHIYNFEGGGIAFNSGCSIKVIHGDNGRMKPEQLMECINPVGNVHYANTSLVVAENTSNKGGGSIYDFIDLEKIANICKENKLRYHLDGARLFNALAETKESTQDYGKIFDSISICFSKGLGAPVGSVLIGNHEFITKARRIRKVFGGGMRQSGYLAAAAIYAIKNNTGRLRDDHIRARKLGETLGSLSFVEKVMPYYSNIVIFRLNDKYSQADFLKKLEEKGMRAIAFGPKTVRMVTHLDFTEDKLTKAIEILKQLS